MSETTQYDGDDLEAMAYTVNYQRWILDIFRPYLGKHIVEVGAGTGTFSEHFLRASPTTLTLLEPSELFSRLKTRIEAIESPTQVRFYNTVFPEAAAEISNGARPDTIIYINVLEHVEDDRAELDLIHKTLAPGGHVLIFVPALMGLYSTFDRMIGHYRRYTKRELEKKCADAGFRIVRSMYFDLAGIGPWYLKFKVLRSHSLNVRAVVAYDRVAIPAVRRFESIVRVPVGKNVLLVAEKTA